MSKLNLLLFFFILVIFSNQSYAACPNVEVINVDWATYTGIWYEIAVSPFPRTTFERDCECTQARYSVALDDRPNLIVENVCRKPSGFWNLVRGTAFVRGSGHLGVKFSAWMPEGDYKIIDYVPGEYSVVWSCSEFFGYDYGKSLWILSRKPSIDAWTYNIILRKIALSTGFDTTTMIPTVQEYCQ